jgi:hypothetical protein
MLKLKTITPYILILCLACASSSSSSNPPAEAGGSTEAAREEAVRASLERGRQVFAAFQKAHPGRFGEIEIRNGDVTVTLDNVRFFWADGRLLPESDLPRRDEYTAQPFYHYPRHLEPIPEYTPEMKAEMDERVKHLDEIPPARHSGIFVQLWRIHNAASADRMCRGMKFFRRGIRVHKDLVPVLRHIEAEINTRARTDRELARFVKSIRSVSGLYWRKIARTETLSHHAFGAAVDVVSANPRRKQTYWLWMKDRDKAWYTRPLSVRHMPPESFVEVFEKHGFIWGGKWLFFDTLHFEYRPDLLILNGFEVVR